MDGGSTSGSLEGPLGVQDPEVVAESNEDRELARWWSLMERLIFAHSSFQGIMRYEEKGRENKGWHCFAESLPERAGSLLSCVLA